MSHIATVSCQIKDLDAFEQAVKNMGGELRRGQQTFRTYQPKQRCIHAVRLNEPKDAYEMGLRYRSASNPEEGYELAYDSYAQGVHLVTKFGQNMVGLQNEYLAVVAEQQLERGGYRVQREVTQSRIEVVAYQ